MKLSDQKIKSCVELKDCLKLILVYENFFGILSRPILLANMSKKGNDFMVSH